MPPRMSPWLKIAKKGSGIETVTYAEALDVAPCYGWIDGQEGAVDDRWWLQRFTPRGSRSRWSKTNCARAIALIEAGQMHPAGLLGVERARADGRWEAAYDSPSRATVPPDLALDANPDARRSSPRWTTPTATPSRTGSTTPNGLRPGLGASRRSLSCSVGERSPIPDPAQSGRQDRASPRRCSGAEAAALASGRVSTPVATRRSGTWLCRFLARSSRTYGS